MKRYVTLGSGRRMGLGRYVKAWKQCLELAPETPIGPGISGYGERACEALEKLRAGLADRINRNIPGYGKGRKWDPDWFWPMARAAHELNYPRLVIRWLPADLMKIPRFRERVEYGRSV